MLSSSVSASSDEDCPHLLCRLAVRILTTAMDTTLPSPEKLEVAVLTREGGGAGGSTVTVHRHLAKPELAALLEANKAAAATAGDV